MEMKFRRTLKKICIYNNITFSNGQTAQGIVDEYLPSEGEHEALFHVLHDDGDKRGFTCFMNVLWLSKIIA